MINPITVKVGQIGPKITVRVNANGTINPTNPVIVGPTAFNNSVLNSQNLIDVVEAYADNAAANAYNSAVAVDDDSEIDGGEF